MVLKLLIKVVLLVVEGGYEGCDEKNDESICIIFLAPEHPKEPVHCEPGHLQPVAVLVHHALVSFGPDTHLLAHSFQLCEQSLIYANVVNLITIQGILCKLTSSSQCAFVFFSSFSVVVIAIDRLLVVTHSSKLQISCKMVGRLCISRILMLYY